MLLLQITTAFPNSSRPPFALLHPSARAKLSFSFLSGSGVAFKLASALWIAAGQPEKIMEFVDLASLGTVADCVPCMAKPPHCTAGTQANGAHTLDGLQLCCKYPVHRRRPLHQRYHWFSNWSAHQCLGRMDDAYWSLQTLLAEGQEATEKQETGGFLIRAAYLNGKHFAGSRGQAST